MNSLKLSSNKITLNINGDDSRQISFNPSDLAFVESFYNLLGDFDEAQEKFTKRAQELDADTETDKFDIPKNMRQKIELTKEVCAFMKERIDNIFGEGTSEKAFEGENDMEMIESFFEGIVPHIQKARDSKVKKYTKKQATISKGLK